MIQAINSIQSINQKALLSELLTTGHPFACWKMPGESSIQLSLSLQAPKKISGTLADSPPGFVVNPFRINHPITPVIIPSDVILSEDGSYECKGGISQFEIEQFLTTLKSNCQEKRPKTDRKINHFKKPDEHQSQKSFTEMVSNAVRLIKRSELDKVVLSRYEDLEVPESFDMATFFYAICKAYPNAFCNIWSLGDGTVWVGASPETLISQQGSVFQTTSLAGTQPLLAQSIKDISWRQKEIEEQALVSRYIINCFKKLRVREFQEKGPKTVAAGSLAHLITSYTVDVDQINFPGLADAMLELLHPTSAVCGMPMQEAIDFIKNHENYDREYYAGFVGPVNIAQKSHLFVNLRCLRFADQVVRLYAGAGITEDSNPEQEYQETILKMDILMSQLSR